MNDKLADEGAKDFQEAWKEQMKLMAADSKPHFTNI